MEKEKTIYFIAPTLYGNAGGLTRATYDKANFLSEYFNVEILTTDFNLNLESVHQELVKSGRLVSKVKVRNMYHEIPQNNFKDKKTPKFDFEDILENIDDYETQHNENWVKVFGPTGLYQTYFYYHDENLKFVDFMDEVEPTRLRRRYVFNSGKLLTMEMWDSGAKTQQVVFNSNKTPILNIFHKNNRPDRVFDMRGKGDVKVKNFPSLIKEWIEGVITDNDIVLIDCFHSRYSDYLDGIDCVKIGFIHNHQSYDNDAKFLTKYSGMDYFVFLTKLQREDYRNINPELYAKSGLLPHPVRRTLKRVRKENKIVTISRLDSRQKNLAPGIKAFAQIAHEFPEINYEIYGLGPERDNLQQLINDLDMKDRIFLKGYTNSSLWMFQQAHLSIALTNYEGYGLSILESLGMSCPVITSNVKYGPTELVKDGETGFIVDNNKVEQIADAIATILRDPHKYQDACLPSVEDRSLESWNYGLLEILEKAIESKEG